MGQAEFRKSHHFKNLPEGLLLELENNSSLKKIARGEYLVKQGSSAHSFFWVKNGRLSVEVPSPQKGALRLQTLSADSLVGWSWIFPPNVWSFDIFALEPTEVYEFHGDALLQTCELHPEWGYAFIKIFAQVMVERLKATRYQLVNLYE